MYTYFVADGAVGDDGTCVKIGKSINPSRRLFSLQTGNPRELSIYHTLCGDFENDLWPMFKKYRMAGEWFSVRGELMDFMVRLKARDLRRGKKVAIITHGRDAQSIDSNTPFGEESMRSILSMLGLCRLSWNDVSWLTISTRDDGKRGKNDMNRLNRRLDDAEPKGIISVGASAARVLSQSGTFGIDKFGLWGRGRHIKRFMPVPSPAVYTNKKIYGHSGMRARVADGLGEFGREISSMAEPPSRSILSI